MVKLHLYSNIQDLLTKMVVRNKQGGVVNTKEVFVWKILVVNKRRRLKALLHGYPFSVKMICL
jgi:hypothetical protein